MQDRLTSIALFGFATLAIGCGLDSNGGGGGTGVSGTGGVGSGGTGGVCVPGSANSCVCSSGAFGAQFCQSNGFLGPCMCGTGGGGGFAGAGTSGGAGAGIGGFGGFSGSAGSGGFGGVGGPGGTGGFGGVGGVAGFSGFGGNGGTGGDVDGGVMCPPCVPPPSPDCVGTGICGCGPYVCPPSDECSDVDGCTACAFPTEVLSSDDCYCALCPDTPMTTSRCEANASSHDKFCADVPIICPLIACQEPRPTACFDSSCEFTDFTF